MVYVALVRTFYPSKRVEDKEVRMGAIQILASVAGDLDLVALAMREVVWRSLRKTISGAFFAC